MLSASGSAEEPAALSASLGRRAGHGPVRGPADDADEADAPARCACLRANSTSAARSVGCSGPAVLPVSMGFCSSISLRRRKSVSRSWAMVSGGALVWRLLESTSIASARVVECDADELVMLEPKSLQESTDM